MDLRGWNKKISEAFKNKPYLKKMLIAELQAQCTWPGHQFPAVSRLFIARQIDKIRAIVDEAQTQEELFEHLQLEVQVL